MNIAYFLVVLLLLLNSCRSSTKNDESHINQGIEKNQSVQGNEVIELYSFSNSDLELEKAPKSAESSMSNDTVLLLVPGVLVDRPDSPTIALRANKKDVNFQPQNTQTSLSLTAGALGKALAKNAPAIRSAVRRYKPGSHSAIPNRTPFVGQNVPGAVQTRRDFGTINIDEIPNIPPPPGAGPTISRTVTFTKKTTVVEETQFGSLFALRNKEGETVFHAGVTSCKTTICEEHFTVHEYFPREARKVLNATADELKASPTLQLSLIEVAVRMRDQQARFMGDVIKTVRGKDAKFSDGEMVAIIKRDDSIGFINGVLEKVNRRNFSTVGLMGDIARGRLNLRNQAEVSKFVRSISTQAEGKGFIVDVDTPRQELTLDDGSIGYAYPRYHIEVADPQTGMKMEWQVGTSTTTEVFETKGIPINNKELDSFMKENGVNGDLHDIGYDIFLPLMNDKSPGVQKMVSDLGISEYYDRVNRFIAKSANEGITPNFKTDLAKLHQDAGKILDGIIGHESGGLKTITSKFHVLSEG